MLLRLSGTHAHHAGTFLGEWATRRARCTLHHPTQQPPPPLLAMCAIPENTSEQSPCFFTAPSSMQLADQSPPRPSCHEHFILVQLSSDTVLSSSSEQHAKAWLKDRPTSDFHRADVCGRDPLGNGRLLEAQGQTATCERMQTTRLRRAGLNADRACLRDLYGRAGS